MKIRLTICPEIIFWKVPGGDEGENFLGLFQIIEKKRMELKSGSTVCDFARCEYVVDANEQINFQMVIDELYERDIDPNDYFESDVLQFDGYDIDFKSTIENGHQFETVMIEKGEFIEKLSDTGIKFCKYLS